MSFWVDVGIGLVDSTNLLLAEKLHCCTTDKIGRANQSLILPNQEKTFINGTCMCGGRFDFIEIKDFDSDDTLYKVE